MDLVPHSRLVDKNQEGYLDCRGTPWEVRGPSPSPGPPAQGFSAGKGISINSGCENQWRLRLRGTGCSGVPSVPVKGPVHRLTKTHFLWAPAQGQELKTYWGHTGETELSGIRTRARQTLSPRWKADRIEKLKKKLNKQTKTHRHRQQYGVYQKERGGGVKG